MMLSSPHRPDRVVGGQESCFIIAELGTDHNGELSKGFDLIDAAAEAGADCAKFQIVYADEIIHPNAGTIEIASGPIPVYQRFKQLERDEDFYRELQEYCKKRGLFFLCSVFGERSSRVLRELGATTVKIASPELNHFPLFEMLNEWAHSAIVSTGMATIGEIEKAYTRLQTQVALLHCITSYPSPEHEFNLRAIPLLQDLFDVPVGVSDHSAHPTLVPLLSVSVGASIIEKHLCLTRGTTGLDDSYALTPDAFTSLCAAVRSGEREGRDNLTAELEREYGEDRVEAILGKRAKKISPSETGHFRATKRSVRARTDITAGTPLSRSNCGVLRSTPRFRVGLSPAYFSLVLGKTTVRDIRAGDGITWEDVFYSL
jgi:N-acetylneuraminate synthase